MLVTVLLGIGAFALTFAETIVSTWEGKADRQSDTATTNHFSLKAAHWAAVFETLLLVDVVLVVYEPVLFAPPIIAAAWLGKYWAVERRRKLANLSAVTPQPRVEG